MNFILCVMFFKIFVGLIGIFSNFLLDIAHFLSNNEDTEMFRISFIKNLMEQKKQTIFTIGELCSWLKIGKNTAYSLIKSGEIKSFRIRGQIHIPEEYVLEYIQEQRKGVFDEYTSCPDEFIGGSS